MIKQLILALLFPAITFATPNDISISESSISHGGTLTISGLDFGTKSPAAPLVWDSGATNPALSTYYDHYIPVSTQQGSSYDMQYRASGFRDIDAPGRGSYYLAGAHAVASGTGSYSTGWNVGIGVNITDYDYFISYYYRIDPDFDEENSGGSGDNMKELVLSNDQANFYPSGGFGYYQWCNDQVPDENYTSDVKFSAVDPVDAQCGYWKCTENGNELDHNSPIDDWIKMQWVGDYDDTNDKPVTVLTTYPDGNVSDSSYYGNGLTTYEYASGEYCGRPDNDDLAFIGLGGFARVPRLNNGINSFRYFSDVYIDVTRARVVLTDSSTYSSSTVVEPQIPSAWTGTDITATVNLGALPSSGTVYLYVFDSDDDSNATGEPITVGSVGSRGITCSGCQLQ